MYWPKSVIHRLAEKIKEGIKFFINHGKDNSHDNRESVGEVLSSFTKEINGRLSNIIIGYFPDKNIVKEMDVCSMEADIELHDETLVEDVDNISAIALGNSNSSSPAFPGALRLNAIQCFEEPKPNSGEEDKTMTFNEVKDAVKNMNIRPWQLYTLDEFKEDRNLAKIFEENTNLKAENERLTGENKTIKDTSADAIRKTAIAEAKTNLNKIVKDAGLTERQRNYIDKIFDPEKLEDLSETGLNKFIEESKKDYAETAKLFGAKDEEMPTKPTSPNSSSSEEALELEALKLIGVK